MSLRRPLTIIIAAAAVLVAAACASNPTAPRGCDVVLNNGSTC